MIRLFWGEAKIMKEESEARVNEHVNHTERM